MYARRLGMSIFDLHSIIIFSRFRKRPKSRAPNFDFDYNGPPVVVSNGMALELVNRFGLNNAWGAFLKLKGYHVTDKNLPQPPEHVQALKVSTLGVFGSNLLVVYQILSNFKN
jgi:hypothetical protein